MNLKTTDPSETNRMQRYKYQTQKQNPDENHIKINEKKSISK